MFSRKIKLTEKELNAKLNQSFLKGYNSGYNAGLNEGLFGKYTPNQIREVLGLNPIIEKSGD
jgi:hypothetical protein